jgi:hypothetical protein
MKDKRVAEVRERQGVTSQAHGSGEIWACAGDVQWR